MCLYCTLLHLPFLLSAVQNRQRLYLVCLNHYNFFATTKKFRDIQLCGTAAISGEYRTTIIPYCNRSAHHILLPPCQSGIFFLTKSPSAAPAGSSVCIPGNEVLCVRFLLSPRQPARPVQVHAFLLQKA